MPHVQPDARPLPPRRFAPLALLLTTLAAAPSLAQGSDSLLAIVNATVLPMHGRSPLTNHTILIDRDRIEAIGPTHQLEVPAGARRIDGTDRFVMPGLIDTHVHLRQADTSALSRYLRAGITTVRDMNGRPLLLEWRDRIRRGELRGPTLLVASPTIGNFSSPREGYPTPRTFEEGRDAVRRFHSAGYDWIKIYSFVPAEGFRGIMAEASALGIPVGGHVPVALAIDSVLRSGVRSVEHLTEYVGTSLIESDRRLDEQDFRSIFHAGQMDTALLDALIDSTIKHRVWNVASIVWFDRHLPAPMARQAWGDTSLRSLGALNRRAIVLRMHTAGALLAIGTDSDAGGNLPAAAIHDELAAHVAAGLPTVAVLRMATIEGARLLGIDDEVGSVHTGRRADLLVLSCNAEENLSCLRAPEVVIAQGRVAR